MKLGISNPLRRLIVDPRGVIARTASTRSRVRGGTKQSRPARAAASLSKRAIGVVSRKRSTSHRHTTIRSITKTVRIACAPRAAFDFLADLGNRPRWAVVNVKSTRPSDDPDWWEMMTPHGQARFRMCTDQVVASHRHVAPTLVAQTAYRNAEADFLRGQIGR